MAVFNEELRLLAYELKEGEIERRMLLRRETVRLFVLLTVVLLLLIPLMIEIQSAICGTAANVQALQDSLAGAA